MLSEAVDLASVVLEILPDKIAVLRLLQHRSIELDTPRFRAARSAAMQQSAVRVCLPIMLSNLLKARRSWA